MQRPCLKALIKCNLDDDNWKQKTVIHEFGRDSSPAEEYMLKIYNK